MKKTYQEIRMEGQAERIRELSKDRQTLLDAARHALAALTSPESFDESAKADDYCPLTTKYPEGQVI